MSAPSAVMICGRLSSRQVSQSLTFDSKLSLTNSTNQFAISLRWCSGRLRKQRPLRPRPIFSTVSFATGLFWLQFDFLLIAFCNSSWKRRSVTALWKSENLLKRNDRSSFTLVTQIDVTLCALHFLRATAVPAGTAEARISYGDSVRLSVRLSRTGAETTEWDRDTGFSPYDSLEFLVSSEVIWCRWVRRFPSNEGIKEGYPP